MTMEFINFLARWSHGLFGITWIGMLYYFNFIQGAYFKEASAEGLADAKEKLRTKSTMVVPLGCNVHLYHWCYSTWRCLSQCSDE